MKTESVIVLPVVARETVFLDWSILDASGEEIARQILYLKQAHAIARALNSHQELLEACKGTEHDLREIRNLVDGLDDDAKYLATIYGLIDGRINSVQSAIAAAEKEKV